MNTYVVTFYDADADLDSDVATREIAVRSAVDSEELGAGEWDAYSLVVEQAREQGGLDLSWEPAHVELPDGEVASVPAGL